MVKRAELGRGLIFSIRGIGFSSNACELRIEYAIPYYNSKIDQKFAGIANEIINSEGSYCTYSNYETVR